MGGPLLNMDRPSPNSDYGCFLGFDFGPFGIPVRLVLLVDIISQFLDRFSMTCEIF